MKRHCPSLLLADELAILQPRHILALGEVPDVAIAGLTGCTSTDGAGGDCFWHYQISKPLPGGRPTITEVWAIPHPSHPHNAWEPGHQEMVAALRTHSNGSHRDIP
jgi:uracil-DNA glycosylase